MIPNFKPDSSVGSPLIAKLKKCLQYNLRLQDHLKEKMHHIQALLAENNEKQRIASSLMKKDRPISQEEVMSQPWFMDNKGECPPDNPDTARKKLLRGGEPIVHRFRRWTVEERQNLEIGIRHQNQAILLKQAYEEMQKLEDRDNVVRQADQKGSEDMDIDGVPKSEPKKDKDDPAVQAMRAAQLQTKINNIRNMPHEELITNCKGIDWRVLSHSYVRTRSAMDCRLQWIGLENPAINQEEWTRDEDRELMRISKENKGLNWVDTATRLNVKLRNNRTPLQCFRRFQRSLNSKLINHKWTAEEDKTLKLAVLKYGENNWREVSAHVKGRTDQQCLHRWTKALADNIKSGTWVKREDRLLRLAVHAYGAKAWARIAKHVPGRTDVKCRERWCNVLDPKLSFKQWTNEESKRLLKMVADIKRGNSTVPWAKIAKHFEPRTDNQVLTQWKKLIKRVERTKYLKARSIRDKKLPKNFVGRRKERSHLTTDDILDINLHSDSDSDDYQQLKVKQEEERSSSEEEDEEEKAGGASSAEDSDAGRPLRNSKSKTKTSDRKVKRKNNKVNHHIPRPLVSGVRTIPLKPKFFGPEQESEVVVVEEDNNNNNESKEAADRKDEESTTTNSTNRKQQKPFKSGDWTCRICQYHNYSRRETCWKCKAYRPPKPPKAPKAPKAKPRTRYQTRKEQEERQRDDNNSDNSRPKRHRDNQQQQDDDDDDAVGEDERGRESPIDLTDGTPPLNPRDVFELERQRMRGRDPRTRSERSRRFNKANNKRARRQRQRNRRRNNNNIGNNIHQDTRDDDDLGDRRDHHSRERPLEQLWHARGGGNGGRPFARSPPTLSASELPDGRVLVFHNNLADPTPPPPRRPSSSSSRGPGAPFDPFEAAEMELQSREFEEAERELYQRNIDQDAMDAQQQQQAAAARRSHHTHAHALHAVEDAAPPASSGPGHPIKVLESDTGNGNGGADVPSTHNNTIQTEPLTDPLGVRRVLDMDVWKDAIVDVDMESDDTAAFDDGDAVVVNGSSTNGSSGSSSNSDTPLVVPIIPVKPTRRRGGRRHRDATSITTTSTTNNITTTNLSTASMGEGETKDLAEASSSSSRPPPPAVIIAPIRQLTSPMGATITISPQQPKQPSSSIPVLVAQPQQQPHAMLPAPETAHLLSQPPLPLPPFSDRLATPSPLHHAPPNHRTPIPIPIPIPHFGAPPHPTQQQQFTDNNFPAPPHGSEVQSGPGHVHIPPPPPPPPHPHFPAPDQEYHNFLPHAPPPPPPHHLFPPPELDHHQQQHPHFQHPQHQHQHQHQPPFPPHFEPQPPFDPFAPFAPPPPQPLYPDYEIVNSHVVHHYHIKQEPQDGPSHPFHPHGPDAYHPHDHSGHLPPPDDWNRPESDWDRDRRDDHREDRWGGPFDEFDARAPGDDRYRDYERDRRDYSRERDYDRREYDRDDRDYQGDYYDHPPDRQPPDRQPQPPERRRQSAKPRTFQNMSWVRPANPASSSSSSSASSVFGKPVATNPNAKP